MKTDPKPLEAWQAEDAVRLKRLFDAREPKMSQAEFGAQFDIGSQGMVWQYIAGRRPLNIKAATAFARGLNVSVEDFSPTIAAQIGDASLAVSAILPGLRPVTDDEDEAPEAVAIKLGPMPLRAGITGFETENLFDDGNRHHIPRQWMEENGLVPQTLLAVKIKGNSMAPLMYEGDIAVIDLSNKTRVSGGVFALNYEGEGVIKRLRYERREWYLVSENPEFRPQPCKGADCQVVGRLVRFDPRNFKDRL